MRSELLLATALAANGCATLDNGHVGSTSQALGHSDVVNQNLAFDNAGADQSAYGSACPVTDPQSPGTAKFMIGAGGRTSGTDSNDAVLFRPGAAYDVNARTTFTDARAFATMITDPNDSHACLMFGGQNGAAVKGQIVKLTAGWSGSAYTLTASNVGALSTARWSLQAVAIPGNKVVLFGGFTDLMSPPTPSAVIDVWDSTQSGSTAIPVLVNQSGSTVTLNHARGDFSAQASGQNASRILLGGGPSLNSIEALELDANGKLNSMTDTHPKDVTNLSPSQHTTIGTARAGLMLLYSARITNDRETWVAGPGSGLAEIQSFDIDWSNFTTANNTAPTDACSSTDLVAVTSPLNIKIANDQFLMVGSSGSNQNSVQEYNAGTCTSVTTDSGNNALVNREGALGALVGNSVYFTAGRNGSTYQTSTFRVF